MSKPLTMSFVNGFPEELSERVFNDLTLAELTICRRVSQSWKISAENVIRQKIQEERRSLPVYSVKGQFLEVVRDNQIVIVVGPTGCGKSTQLTQYLAEAGYAEKGKIACTQPRQIAATSVAQRVAEEYECPLGQQVGYSIQFDDKTSDATIIKYMTDAALIRECILDQDLSSYSVIIIDEAHERSLHTDVLFGVVKEIARKRSDLKLIILSATLDSQKFSNFFNNAPIFRIEGPSHPVQIIYNPYADQSDVKYYLRHVSEIRDMEIYQQKPPGDILVFMAGQDDIEKACEQLKKAERMSQQLLVYPVYSHLESEELAEIFKETPEGKRKVIFTETPLTVNGIVYVIDSVFVKENVYKPRLRKVQLEKTTISRAQADQRTSCAASTGSGKCYRLYSEEKYRSLEESKKPDIFKYNLANIVLQLKAIGFQDLNTFQLMDRPPVEAMDSAFKELLALGALDDQRNITPLGRKMAGLPVDPELAKMLIKSVELQCSEEMITIVAMLSVPANFYSFGRDHEETRSFSNSYGDHLMFLDVYNKWKNSGYDDEWCKNRKIEYRNMCKARQIRRHLEGIMHRYNLPLISCGWDLQWTSVRKTILHGYPKNVAKKVGRTIYNTVEGIQVYIHPSSTLFRQMPSCVVYHEMKCVTYKSQIKVLTAIEPSWQEIFRFN